MYIQKKNSRYRARYICTFRRAQGVYSLQVGGDHCIESLFINS